MSTYQLLETNETEYAVIKDGVYTYTIKYKQKAWSCDCPARKECKHLRMLPEHVKVVKHHRDDIKQAIQDMRFLFPKTMFEVCGSYRRGELMCKDMDILIQCTQEEFNILKSKIPHDISGDRIIRGTWEGIPFDIEWVDLNEWASYLLYRTGSKALNIKMRQIAKELGWTLNEHGIVKPEGLCRFDSEMSIFYELGMLYIPPIERNWK